MKELSRLLFILILFGGIYFLYNRGNIALFLGKTTKVNAHVDSIKGIYGTKGIGFHQKIYYQYSYNNNNNNKFNSSFINKATMWEPLIVEDSLQLKIAINKPSNNKVIGVYFSYK